MSVTEAVDAFVAGLGALSGRRGVAAAEAVRLARLLDDEEAGAAAASLSRELRLLVASLDSAVTLPAAAAAAGEVVREDPVAKVRDEVARKRQQRAGRA